MNVKHIKFCLFEVHFNMVTQKANMHPRVCESFENQNFGHGQLDLMFGRRRRRRRPRLDRCRRRRPLSEAADAAAEDAFPLLENGRSRAVDSSLNSKICHKT